MANPAPEKKPAAVNPNPDWQDNDIKLGPVVASLVLIAVVTAVAAYWMYALFGRYQAQVDARDAQVPAMATVREIPPAPNLQVNGRMELTEYQTAQAGLLDHYAYTDKMRGIGRIPIDRAMHLLAVDAPEEAPAPAAPEPTPAPKTEGHH